MNAIETHSLTRRFGSRCAVDHLDLTVAEGEIFALLGQNGAGKTTAIRMLTCLLPPSEGDALVFGHRITAEPAAVRALLNLSPQQNAVARSLTVRENLILFARLWGASPAEAGTRADEIMDVFALTDRAHDRAKTLSGGLERRLSVAMAMITRPRILFLDEPTLGLDVRARRELWRLIEAWRGKLTVILTTHYLEEAAHLADRIGILQAGRLLATGTTDQLCAAAGTASLEDAFLALTDRGEVSA